MALEIQDRYGYGGDALNLIKWEFPGNQSEKGNRVGHKNLTVWWKFQHSSQQLRKKIYPTLTFKGNWLWDFLCNKNPVNTVFNKTFTEDAEI